RPGAVEDRPIRHARNADSVVILDVTVRWIIRHVGPKVIVKTASGRPVGDDLLEIDIAQPIWPAGRWPAIPRWPLPAEVPFADARCRISVVLKEFADC